MIFRAGLLPAETIENALEEGVKTGRRLGEILVERGLIKEEDLTRLLAGQKGLPFVSLRERSVDPEAARLLAEDQARLLTALPIGFEDGVPVVALADPTNDLLNRNVREALGQEARFVVAVRSELNDVIGEVFSGALEAPEPPRVDTSVPAPEPNPETESAPESTPQLDAAAYEAETQLETEAEPEPESMPERAAEAMPEPEPPLAEPELEPEREPQPVGAGHAPPEAEPESLPVPAEVSVPEPPAEPAFEPPPDPEPEPLVAPLAVEPVAEQSLPQSNGQIPENFEDDSPPPAPAADGTAYRVSIRLTSGERVLVAECEEIGEAKGYAKALTKQLGSADSEDWPFVKGRFLKPDTIVSVDVEEI